MNNLIDNFIKNNNLDENIKYILIDFVNKCFLHQLGITTYNNNDISNIIMFTNVLFEKRP
jgi:hypothetical protein